MNLKRESMMNEARAEYRISKLPEAIRDRVDPNDPCWSYVPDGWREIVVKLDTELRAVDPDYTLAQVKEKFGGLRYYVDFSEQCTDTEKAYEILDKYEQMSVTICDMCGKQGKHRSKDGWLATRCEEHD